MFSYAGGGKGEMMKKPQIEKDAYEAWAKNKFIEYASCSIPMRPGFTQRLVFGMFVGGYLVTLGDKTLYEGGSFSAAQTIFNSEA